MLSFISRRLVVALPTLLVVIAGSFFLMRAAPGGPFDADAQLEPEVIENLRAAYDLDKPVTEQFLLYMARLLRGDFGPSITYADYTVSELLAIGLPVSVKLGLTAIVVALLFGCLMGIISALNRNRWIDYVTMSIAMTGFAVPAFVVAPVLTLVFGLYLKLLPISGWNDGALQNMVLPVIALALPQIAILSRLTRGSMLEVMRQNYIRTARAKGLPEYKVVAGHALKAVSLPLVSYLGPAIAGIMTGSVIIEQIFGLPGMGRYFIQGALNRDYPLVMGTVIVYATAIILLNLLADVIYGYLDPRVRRE
ncbi:MAG: ABC transporter permease subunit [Gammaproteobacteria bacterium]|nr:ABC transporter permease subunit [Gammaproteobacteria bacterium]TVQ46590.1 MAG: ABC transporter permease subunit [Gammaproteobacteria bacterium]